MIEVVVSRSRKVNTGKYEMADVFASVKAQVLEPVQVKAELDKLNKEVEAFVEAEAKKLKEKAYADENKEN